MSLTLTTSNLTLIEGEPRVLDTDLARALGFSKPADIKGLIRRHLVALERFGEVFRTMPKTSQKGGRPSKENWLNKKQALYLCTKSETKNATEVTIRMVEVFDDFLSNRQPAQLQPQQAKAVRHLTRAEKQRENQINWKKRQFAGLAIDLDDLGVDVLSIDMTIVIAFGRAMRLQGAR